MTGVLVVHPGAELYGSDRMVMETITGLLERGCRVTVVLPAEGPLVGELSAIGATVRICPMPVLRKSALSPRGLLRLASETLVALRPMWRLTRARDVDTVLVNTMIIPLWLVLARLAGRRAVCHVHEAEHSAPRIVRLGLYAPLLCAQTIVLNSRFSRDVLVETLPVLHKRSTVVYNGVLGPDVPPRPPRTDPQGSGPVRLLFIGRLSPRKGPQVAIEALDLLVRRGIDAHLGLLGAVFVGYEWFAADLHQQVRRLGLDQRIAFHGFQPDIWPYLAESDVCLVPSVADEPFGNTAVEAVLAHRPLVVSATSGLLEAAEGYRCVRSVPPGDSAAAAMAVTDLLRDWDDVVAKLGQDAAVAVARHAPGGFRAAMATAVVRGAPNEGSAFLRGLLPGLTKSFKM